jgi:D-3-phosphoglycerate dehydrogenase
VSANPVIYVTQPIHPDGLELLNAHATVLTPFGAEPVALEDALPRIEGFLVRYEGLSAEAIVNAPKLRAISRAGAGYENIAVAAAKGRHIPVLIPHDANARTVAEHVYALALSVLREIPRWDARVRAGEPDLGIKREGELSHDLSGKVLGLVGVGRIGREVARIGRDGFLMDVLAHHPSRPDDYLRAQGAEPTGSLEELLGVCDIISIQVPLNESTRGMFGAAQFEATKAGAVIVNVSRGGVVDETALADSLRSGHLGGAGVDVWLGKVPPPDNPLLGVPRVVATPHRASRTEEAQSRAAVLAAQGLLDMLAGRAPTDMTDVAGVLGTE